LLGSEPASPLAAAHSQSTMVMPYISEQPWQIHTCSSPIQCTTGCCWQVGFQAHRLAEQGEDEVIVDIPPRALAADGDTNDTDEADEGSEVVVAAYSDQE
jgi:hypothetical protein